MRIFILISAAGLLVASCKTRHKAIANQRVSYDSLHLSEKKGSDSLLRKNWQYFSGRLAMDYNSEDQSLSGAISLRMKKDSIIWFSATAVLGIQVAKGIITKDSVKILDIYERKYMEYSIAELGQMFGVQLGLRELQNLILANPVFDTMEYQQDALSGGWVAVENPITNVLFARIFQPADSSMLTQKGSMRQLQVRYSGSKNAGSYAVPAFMNIVAGSEAKTVRMAIEFTTASDAVIPSYPFAVPADYTKTE